MVKVRATRKYRQLCAWLAQQARPLGWSPRRLEIHVEYRCSRGAAGYAPRDVQNAIAALKAAIDGALKDAGIVPDDSARWLAWGRTSLVTRKSAKGDGVTLTGWPA